MNVNLAQCPLYEKQIIEAARQHGNRQRVETKREFDRAATFFRKHVVTLNPNIDKAYTEQKDIAVIIGSENNINRIVTIFNGALFTTTEQLEKMVQKRCKAIEIFVKPSKKDKVEFRFIGATVNLDQGKDRLANTIVACAEFRSAVRVHNFCHIKD